MTIRDILRYPDPCLRTKADEVEPGTRRLRELIADLAETMYAAPGLGLAAPQVGVSQRVFVIDMAGAGDPSELRVFVNPVITCRSGTQCHLEGCLSFPGIEAKIERAAQVSVRALDQHGVPFELTAEGLLAVAIQHEHDHLDGVLIIDHLNPPERHQAPRAVAERRRPIRSA